MSIIASIQLLKKRRTRIISTIGPASANTKTIHRLIQAGVNIFRLNMSHGDYDFHRKSYRKIRSLAEKNNMPVAILADLCGPKIRTGEFIGGQIMLREREHVTVTTRKIKGKAGLIPSQYTKLHKELSPGNRILINDGKLELKVKKIQDTEILCTIVHGGVLTNHKGINLPDINVSTPALTPKDKKDAKFMLELGVDFFALSFVRSAKDVKSLRGFITSCKKDAAIIAKFEKPQALDDVNAIIEESDGIMVARGDLGIEVDPARLPVIQHQLIDLARNKLKPVIVATQMLESMIENATPTRAEVTDVSNAVTLSADAVMLSGETAVGKYPVTTVKMMDRIIRQTESYLWKHGVPLSGENNDTKKSSIWRAIAEVTASLSRKIHAHAILVVSRSGISVATMSASRPSAPIIAIVPTPEIWRRINILWGVVPVLLEEAAHSDPTQLARDISKNKKLAKSGENVLLIRGFHTEPKLNTPSVTVLTV